MRQPAQWDFVRRILVSAAAAVLLAALYSMIFRFSAQDAEESGSLSQFVSEKCVDIVNVLTGSRWSEVKKAGLAEYIEHPVRKLAHFSEYACMGVLVYVLLSQWLKKGARRNLLTAVWVFLSAAGDEFHQYFVPGRYASFMDVLLDTCGGVFGMLFCICTAVLCRRHAEKKRRKKGSGSGGKAQVAVKAAESETLTEEIEAEAEVLAEEIEAESEVPAEETEAESETLTEEIEAEAEVLAEEREKTPDPNPGKDK